MSNILSIEDQYKILLDKPVVIDNGIETLSLKPYTFNEIMDYGYLDYFDCVGYMVMEMKDFFESKEEFDEYKDEVTFLQLMIDYQLKEVQDKYFETIKLFTRCKEFLIGDTSVVIDGFRVDDVTLNYIREVVKEQHRVMIEDKIWKHTLFSNPKCHALNKLWENNNNGLLNNVESSQASSTKKEVEKENFKKDMSLFNSLHKQIENGIYISDDLTIRKMFHICKIKLKINNEYPNMINSFNNGSFNDCMKFYSYM